MTIPELGRANLEWRDGKKRTEGPFEGEVTKWSAISGVPDGVLYWSITRAAPERFVLRVKDDNRIDTVWLGHRPTFDEAKAVAERLQFVLATPSLETPEPPVPLSNPDMTQLKEALEANKIHRDGAAWLHPYPIKLADAVYNAAMDRAIKLVDWWLAAAAPEPPTPDTDKGE